MKNFSQLNLQLVLLLLICFAKDLKACQDHKPGYFPKSCLFFPDRLSLKVVYKSTNPEFKAAEAKAAADAAVETKKPLLIEHCDLKFWANPTAEAILTKKYLKELKEEKARKKAEEEQEAKQKKLSASNTPEKSNTSPATEQ